MRLLTYNIHKGVGTDGRRDLGRIADVVRHYDPDVVALQEVMWFDGRRGRRPQAPELAKRIGLSYGAVALNCPKRVGIYGNVTFSRPELLEHRNLDLTVPLKRPRAALHTLVRGEDGDVHVFNVHLGLVGVERTAQARRLVAEIDELAPQSAPVVVLGDTNDWNQRLGPRVLEPAGFRDVAVEAASFPSWYPVARIDRVYVRGELTVKRAFSSRLPLARVASDHLPVVVDVVLGTESGRESRNGDGS